MLDPLESHFDFCQFFARLGSPVSDRSTSLYQKSKGQIEKMDFKTDTRQASLISDGENDEKIRQCDSFAGSGKLKFL